MKSTIYFIFILFLSSWIKISAGQYPKREMRGAWVATVENIDWPASPAETSGEQISELVDLFDKLKSAGINTVFFQVRTECDALYKSSYEPWSYWLTGRQGKAPDPFYDPLAFAIEEAHAKGMELHAWINPYRAVKDISDYIISENHISRIHPEWILKFGSYEMLNPGIPAVTDYIAKIVTDIISRYNVDGIHLDDYFYPYTPQITNQDSATFKTYKNGFTNIDDWRRNNINSMIAKVNETINRIKPEIIFGVSPFGIVENKYANTSGFDAYNKIYCDPLTWIKDKTVDYVVPQLYWEIGNKYADFKKLLPWWASIKNERDIYIGLNSSKIASADWEGAPYELYDEIRMARQFKNIGGVILFSAKSIAQNYSGLADSLKDSFFKYTAFVPEMKWKNYISPDAPFNLTVVGNDSSRTLNWLRPVISTGSSLSYVVYRFYDNEKIDLNNPQNILNVVYQQSSFTDNDILLNKYRVTYIVTSLSNKQVESSNYAEASIKIKN
ncbi:MAG: family 10 glycosylhydrolase [Ignavibacteriaceae bacterium]